MLGYKLCRVVGHHQQNFLATFTPPLRYVADLRTFLRVQDQTMELPLWVLPCTNGPIWSKPSYCVTESQGRRGGRLCLGPEGSLPPPPPPGNWAT